MELSITDNDLLLNYEQLTEKCLWSIFDLAGVEISKGKLDGRPPHKIAVNNLTTGLYQLCVIDGDNLRTIKFCIK